MKRAFMDINATNNTADKLNTSMSFTSPVRDTSNTTRNQLKELIYSNGKNNHLLTVQELLEDECNTQIHKLQAMTSSQLDHFREEFSKTRDMMLHAIQLEREKVMAEYLQENGEDSMIENGEEQEETMPITISKPVVIDDEHVEDQKLQNWRYHLSIKCKSGPYQNKSYKLQLHQTNRICYIGRSTGKKFQSPNGLSLPKDSEISITHGKIEMDTKGALFYMDLDSTNGSTLNDTNVLPGRKIYLQLNTTTNLGIGQTELQLTFL